MRERDGGSEAITVAPLCLENSVGFCLRIAAEMYQMQIEERGGDKFKLIIGGVEGAKRAPRSLQRNFPPFAFRLSPSFPRPYLPRPPSLLLLLLLLRHKSGIVRLRRRLKRRGMTREEGGKEKKRAKQPAACCADPPRKMMSNSQNRGLPLPPAKYSSRLLLLTSSRGREEGRVAVWNPGASKKILSLVLSSSSSFSAMDAKQAPSLPPSPLHLISRRTLEEGGRQACLGASKEGRKGRQQQHASIYLSSSSSFSSTEKFPARRRREGERPDFSTGGATRRTTRRKAACIRGLGNCTTATTISSAIVVLLRRKRGPFSRKKDNDGQRTNLTFFSRFNKSFILLKQNWRFQICLMRILTIL